MAAVTARGATKRNNKVLIPKITKNVPYFPQSLFDRHINFNSYILSVCSFLFDDIENEKSCTQSVDGIVSQESIKTTKNKI